MSGRVARARLGENLERERAGERRERSALVVDTLWLGASRSLADPRASTRRRACGNDIVRGFLV